MPADDISALLEEVGRFCDQRVASAAQRPESPIEPSVLHALSEEARELGILPQADGDPGFALWEHTDGAEAMAFNVGVLQRLGEVCPGLAFAWHRAALACWLAKRLGITQAVDTLVATGHYGLARGSLARWLRGKEDSIDDEGLLEDWLDRDAQATVLVAEAEWRSLLWPVWDEGGVAWELASRAALDVTPRKAQHGLDELSASLLRAPRQGARYRTQDAQRLYRELLQADFIGLLAIAVGNLGHGQRLAWDYAALRQQGGKRIVEHAAVRVMLGEIDMAHQQTAQVLRQLARPLGELDLGLLAGWRVSLFERLGHAANQVMQVHGGVGYMRDCGPEKILRDMNMLGLQSGGTRELPLFVAAWTER